MITVLNKRTYCGKGEYIDRPSPLGNPFAIGRDGTRAEVIIKYREWLADHWFSAGNTHPAKRELQRLIDLYEEHGKLTLVCWCAPLACHGDVISQAIIHETTFNSPEGNSP